MSTAMKPDDESQEVETPHPPSLSSSNIDNSKNDTSSGTNQSSNENTNYNGSRRGRKLGRASRRRQHKIRAIRQSVQILLSGTNNESSETQGNNSMGEATEDENLTCLPTDRSRSLPGVITRRRQLNHGQFHNGDDCDSTKSQLQGNGFYKEDERMLTSQLGFIPGNAISVVSRVKDIQQMYPALFTLLSKPPVEKYGTDTVTNISTEQKEDHPMVLQLYPLVTRDIYHGGKSDGRKFKSRKRGYSKAIGEEQSEKNQNDNENKNNNPEANKKDETTTTIEPFPTMYWLTHPYLRTLISQLEIEPTRNVKTMEEKLSSQPNYIQTMKYAHESYGNQRWELLTEDDQQNTIDRKWVDALGMKRGVAGIRNFQTVKCLHTHAAHYLAQVSTRILQNKAKEDHGVATENNNNDDDVKENLVGRWALEAVEELILNGGKI